MLEFFQIPIVEGTLGFIILSAMFTGLGFIIKGWLENHGNISVAKINANVSLGSQAIEVMTAAMEALKDENHGLKQTLAQMESHMDRIIELLLEMMKAETQEDADKAVLRLQQFLKSIGRWPY